jgi:hypothetical protein
MKQLNIPTKKVNKTIAGSGLANNCSVEKYLEKLIG